MKVDCGWPPVHTSLRNAELVAICQVILKARIFLALIAKFNAIHIEEQACHLKLTRRVGNMFRFTKKALNKSILLMVRQAHHERNQQVTVHPEPVEGFNQRFTSETQGYSLASDLFDFAAQ